MLNDFSNKKDILKFSYNLIYSKSMFIGLKKSYFNITSNKFFNNYLYGFFLNIIDSKTVSALKYYLNRYYIIKFHKYNNNNVFEFGNTYIPALTLQECSHISSKLTLNRIGGSKLNIFFVKIKYNLCTIDFYSNLFAPHRNDIVFDILMVLLLYFYKTPPFNYFLITNNDDC